LLGEKVKIIFNIALLVVSLGSLDSASMNAAPAPDETTNLLINSETSLEDDLLKIPNAYLSRQTGDATYIVNLTKEQSFLYATAVMLFNARRKSSDETLASLVEHCLASYPKNSVRTKGEKAVLDALKGLVESNNRKAIDLDLLLKSDGDQSTRGAKFLDLTHELLVPELLLIAQAKTKAFKLPCQIQ